MKKLFSTLVEKDSHGIFHNAPNAKYKKWEINSLGFRGEEIDLEKREGQIRIVCLGGSETFGYYENKGKEWPSKLGEMLRDKFPRVEVINGSVVGQHLKKRKDYVEKYVLPLRPDIMIIFHQRFFDYMRVSNRRGGDKHSVNNGKVKKVKYPVTGKPSIETPPRVPPECEDTKKRGLLERFLTHIRTRRLQRKVREKERKYLINKEPLDEAPEDFILEYVRELRSFTQYLIEKNITPVLSTYPTLVTPFNKDIYKDLLLAYRRIFCIELSENGILDALSKLSHANRKIAEEQNLVFVENEHLIPKTLEYFSDNCHFTDKGAEIIARNCYNVLNHFNIIK